MAILPANRPMWPRERVAALLLSREIRDAVCLVGVRGYFRDSMGKAGVNDCGIYDDAIFLLAPQAFAAFNANCDPSLHRVGTANLAAGLWRYKVGIHGLSKPKRLQYTALVQAAEVTVQRDGKGPDTGFFGINIHRGGESGTSSLGCQTIHPSQWPAFIALVKVELKRAGQFSIPYLLVEEQG